MSLVTNDKFDQQVGIDLFSTGTEHVTCKCNPEKIPNRKTNTFIISFLSKLKLLLVCYMYVASCFTVVVYCSCSIYSFSL